MAMLSVPSNTRYNSGDGRRVLVLGCGRVADLAHDPRRALEVVDQVDLRQVRQPGGQLHLLDDVKQARDVVTLDRAGTGTGRI